MKRIIRLVFILSLIISQGTVSLAKPESTSTTQNDVNLLTPPPYDQTAFPAPTPALEPVPIPATTETTTSDTLSPSDPTAECFAPKKPTESDCIDCCNRIVPVTDDPTSNYACQLTCRVQFLPTSN